MTTSEATTLIRRNLVEIFSEPSRETRDLAIDALVHADIQFQDAENSVSGIDAFKDHVAELLANLAGLEFSVAQPADAVGDLGRIGWSLAPPGGDPVAAGVDLGLSADGKLVRLWTFLEGT